MVRQVYSSFILWLSCLACCYQGVVVDAQSLVAAPFRVSQARSIQQKHSSDNGTTVFDPFAAHIRLPWATTTILGDYFFASGMEAFWKKQLLMTEEEEEQKKNREAHFTTVEGGHWRLSQSTDASTNFQYLYANDQATHSQTLTMLAHGSFDSVLESLGQFWDLQHGITLYSLGFVGATYANGGGESNSNVLRQSHAVPVTSSNTPRSFQLLIPLYLKEGSRPELQIQPTHYEKPVKIQHEVDVAVVFGDTSNYGPGTFDYRDSPGEVHMAFSLYFWVHDGQDTTVRPSLSLPSFALEWLQASTGRHWNPNDPSMSLPPLQQEQKYCGTSGEGDNDKVCRASSSSSSPQTEKDVIFWASPRSYDWYNWTFQEFKDNLECSSLLSEYDFGGDDESSTSESGQPKQRRQPPTQDTWKQLREIYNSIVGHDQSTLSLEQDHLDSFHVNVTAKPSVPGRGRGVFADQFIPKGTLVYTPQQQARFSNGDHYKQFVMSVSVELACDLIAWMSIQKVVIGGVEQPPLIVVDLDDGALVNSGYRPKSMDMNGTAIGVVEGEDDGLPEGEEYANVGCIPDLAIHTINGCSENDFALEDIQVGEELLIDYEEYVNVDRDVWVSFGLKNEGDVDDEEEDSIADDENAEDVVEDEDVAEDEDDPISSDADSDAEITEAEYAEFDRYSN